MEPQTSFIPKRPLTKDSVVRDEPIGIFVMLTTVIFFLSLLSGIGVYFYKILVQNEIKNSSVSLERAEKAFDPALIVELERLDKRIESAKQILGKHVVITPIFRLLEDTTIPLVRFNRFNYALSSSGEIELTLSGETRGYAYVAGQSDLLGKSKYITQHIFSNLNLDNSGNVTFDLFAVVDPSLVSYASFINREATPAGEEQINQ